MAITNCLNFGNPYDPEVYWQFKESVRGITHACQALGTPITGGDVSFYNRTETNPIYPTPVIGMLGKIESADCITTINFKRSGDLIVILGKTLGYLGGSAYVELETREIRGGTPPIDLYKGKQCQAASLQMIEERIVISRHDISGGGSGVLLAECCLRL